MKIINIVKYRNVLCKDCKAAAKVGSEDGNLRQFKHRIGKGLCRKDAFELRYHWYVELQSLGKPVHLGPYDAEDEAIVVAEAIRA